MDRDATATATAPPRKGETLVAVCEGAALRHPRVASAVACLLNAHAALDARNACGCLAYGPGTVNTLVDAAPRAADAPPGAALLEALAEEEGGTAARGAAPLSAALSTALCVLGRERERGRADGARILAVVTSPDAPAQYVAVMNAIFGAQRHSVVIDACAAGDADSGYLQQAAHLTGGVYLRPQRPEGLLQYFISAFTADASARTLVRTLPPPSVDFRAACFCHKRPIEVGYVCSVCLSIFCEKRDVCSTCASPFEEAAK